MTTYAYAIETSDDGLPNETPWKVWQIVDTGTSTEKRGVWASTYGSHVLANYLDDHRPPDGWAGSGLDVRIAVWTGEQPLEDIRQAAAVIYV